MTFVTFFIRKCMGIYVHRPIQMCPQSLHLGLIFSRGLHFINFLLFSHPHFFIFHTTFHVFHFVFIA